MGRAYMTIKHNHRWFFLWKPDCPRCYLNQLLRQCDREMFLFYVHNSSLFNYWEKQYIKEKYCS